MVKKKKKNKVKHPGAQVRPAEKVAYLFPLIVGLISYITYVYKSCIITI